MIYEIIQILACFTYQTIENLRKDVTDMRKHQNHAWTRNWFSTTTAFADCYDAYDE